MILFAFFLDYLVSLDLLGPSYCNIIAFAEYLQITMIDENSVEHKIRFALKSDWEDTFQVTCTVLSSDQIMTYLLNSKVFTFKTIQCICLHASGEYCICR